MAIDKLYLRVEQEFIAKDIESERAKYNGFHKKAVRYFREKAGSYHLYQRVSNQIKAWKAGILEPEEMTTNSEIARLFKVSRSAVSRYLEEKALENDEIENFRERIKILRCAGGYKGGKNGDKAANFKKRNSESYKNS